VLFRSKLRLPPSTMSNACDDIIRDLSETFEIAEKKGSLDISDLFKVMGNQMELHLNEEKERENDQKKTDAPPKKQARGKTPRS